MPTFEGYQPHTIEFYDSGLEKRKTPHDLNLGNIFTLMVALEDQPEIFEAHSVPILVVNQSELHQETGSWVVGLCTVDDDLNPMCDSKWYCFEPGGMLIITDELLAEEPSLREGYVKDYDDGLGWMLEIYTELSVSAGSYA